RLVLDRPAEHDLSGRPIQARRDPGDRRILQAFATLERAVGLEHDSLLQAIVEQPAPVLERAELHLVDGRRAGRAAHQLPEAVTAEVADADLARQPESLQRLELAPKARADQWQRPVDQIEIDIVE